MHPHNPAQPPRRVGNDASRVGPPATIPLRVEDAGAQARVVVMRGNVHVSFVVTDEALLDEPLALAAIAEDALALVFATQSERPDEATEPVLEGRHYRIVLARAPELAVHDGLIFRQRVYRLEDDDA